MQLAESPESVFLHHGKKFILMIKQVKLSHCVMWIRHLPARFCFYVRNQRLLRVIIIVFLFVLYCEFLHYYVILLCCTWPSLTKEGNYGRLPLRAMFIGDTHILGSDAHWFDKLRREWQMVRSFQASMFIHSPDVVFILGDLLDNGKVCSKEEFDYHVSRFKTMFSTPTGTHTEIVVGNHDVGFHYMMTDMKHNRFKTAFDAPSVRTVTIRDVTFILINSMAMEGDGCHLCDDAEEKIREIKWQLKCSKGAKEERKVAEICSNIEVLPYTQPILLQHFPMYRDSDKDCMTPDAAPDEERYIPFREKWDCLSKESSNMLLESLDPRLIISAHTHHGCYRVHANNAPEYTVASFNWRNKQTPSFLLAEINGSGFSINRCYLPNELTVISLYITCGILVIACLILPTSRNNGQHKIQMSVSNKLH
ncbi:Metallophosphoesterase 1 [Mactra antiquata]